jgi:hypothetical protein
MRVFIPGKKKKQKNQWKHNAVERTNVDKKKIAWTCQRFLFITRIREKYHFAVLVSGSFSVFRLALVNLFTKA